MAELICRPTPKKGLITDLDDTLWDGILGEVGVKGVSWSLDRHSHLHGIYQQFLASLASSGILIGVASKNDAVLVEKAFEREDLLLRKEVVFPVVANWAQKSESIKQILKKWNVLADSVVFLDDSPMEVAEVQRTFPEMECLLFPKSDYSKFWSLLNHLRDVFSKNSLSEEDLLRLQSIRNVATLPSMDQNKHSLGEFLNEAGGRLTFIVGKPVGDMRALELINKTNQFNLNGRRYDEAAWSRLLNDPSEYALTVAYEDKFGKLGRISVLIGRPQHRKLFVESWVLSCRAFSRRIEFHMLQHVFQKLALDEIVFDVEETPRNGPLMDFLRLFADGPVESKLVLHKDRFCSKAPELPDYSIEEVAFSG
jgi:FkbH-like protein